VKPRLFQLSISTPDGRFIARYSAKGLAGLDFPVNGRAELPLGPDAQFTPKAFGAGRAPTQQNAIPAHIRAWHRAAESTLKNALTGRAAKNLPPLDLRAGTEFQRKVWKALRKISVGRTKSYGEIARAIGEPKAVRAVGGACGANPIPVLVPCHRVLAAHGNIGGFGGGLEWKRKLLAREGIVL